ncbi:MAG: hypothetical protein AB7O49_22235 [Sphingomonadales bacterium]
MSHPPKVSKSIDDLLDMILMEMGVNHPQVTPEQEGELKQALLAIMEDEDGWRRDPHEMRRRFQTAMNAVLNAQQSHN